MMGDPDLAQVQKRVDDSRRDFLAALHSYEKDGSDDGEAITARFLVKFLGPEPKRSELAKDEADETIALIRTFGATRASVASNVALMGLKMDLAVTSLTIEFLSKSIEAIGGSADVEGTTRGIDTTPGQILENLRKGRDKLKDAGRAANTRAAAIGEHVVRVQRLGATLLLTRQASLRQFRSENLEFSWAEIGERLNREMNDGTKEEMFQKTWDIACELAAAVLEIALEDKSPLHKVPRYWRKIRRVFRGNEQDTAPGGTEKMQTLLVTLRRENALLVQLEQAYSEAMSALETLSGRGVRNGESVLGAEARS